VGETSNAVPVRRAACLLGGALATGMFGPAVQAADAPRPTTAAVAKASGATTSSSSAATAAADVELLEFLGSDDADPELQQYLANRVGARDGSDKR
jgi:hypothetical protein